MRVHCVQKIEKCQNWVFNLEIDTNNWQNIRVFEIHTWIQILSREIGVFELISEFSGNLCKNFEYIWIVRNILSRGQFMQYRWMYKKVLYSNDCSTNFFGTMLCSFSSTNLTVHVSEAKYWSMKLHFANFIISTMKQN